MIKRCPGSLETWEYEYTHPQLRHEKVVNLFRTLTGKKFLDIGCGNGYLTKMLMEVLGVKWASGVDSLKGRGTALPKGLEIFQRDLNIDRLPGGHYDIIHCGETIEHIYDTDHLLDEIYRVLKPGGIGVITTPNLASWPSRLVFLLGYQPYASSVSIENETVGKIGLNGKFHGQWGHIRPFTLRALKDLLVIHNLKIVKVEGWEIGTMDIHLNNSFLLKVVNAADKIISRIPSLAPRVAVVFKKEG